MDKMQTAERFLASLPESDALKKAEQVLIDNGIDKDEVENVMQALGYALLDTELYPTERLQNVEVTLYVCFEEHEPNGDAPIVQNANIWWDGSKAIAWFQERMEVNTRIWGVQWGSYSPVSVEHELDEKGSLQRIFVDGTETHAVTIRVMRKRVSVIRHVPNNGDTPYADVGFCYMENTGYAPRVHIRALVKGVEIAGSEQAAKQWLVTWGLYNKDWGYAMDAASRENAKASIWNNKLVYVDKEPDPLSVSTLFVKKHRVALPAIPYSIGDLLICKPEESKRSPESADHEVYAEVANVMNNESTVTLVRYLKQGRLPTFDVILPFWEASKLYKPMNEEERALFLENTRKE